MDKKSLQHNSTDPATNSSDALLDTVSGGAFFSNDTKDDHSIWYSYNGSNNTSLSINGDNSNLTIGGNLKNHTKP